MASITNSLDSVLAIAAGSSIYVWAYNKPKCIATTESGKECYNECGIKYPLPTTTIPESSLAVGTFLPKNL
ncbi:hypothetical protein HYX14_06605 [Candidatus Woesearchaeota archaeon]|nr:hypothetical protein [Candidatus Woesearchaeota archaeon]